MEIKHFIAIVICCVVSFSSSETISAKCNKAKSESAITAMEKNGTIKRSVNDRVVRYDMMQEWEKMSDKQREKFLAKAFEDERCYTGDAASLHVYFNGKDAGVADVFGGVELVKPEPVEDETAPLPKYELSLVSAVPGIKIGFEGIIDKPVSKTMLERLHAKVVQENDGSSYQRVFVTWYLPHYKKGRGAWGTTQSEDGKISASILKLQN